MSLLERFQADCELDSVGEFTLDESKARKKMARFQLVTLEEFLMLAVQAAVAAECQAIHLTIDGLAVRMVATAAQLHPEAVQTLGDFLFDSLAENVSYHLLAIAANAIEPACAREPVVAMLDDDLHFEIELKETLGGLAALLSTRLLYLPCPLTLNDETLTTEPLPEQGRVELRPDSDVTTIVLVRHGVIVGRDKAERSINVDAVMPANELALDASFSHVVQDERYLSVIKTVARIANELLAQRARQYREGDKDELWLLAHLAANHAQPAKGELEAAALFPQADRPGCLSLRELRQLTANRQKLLVSRRRFNLQLDQPVVYLRDSAVEQVLLDLLGSQALEDAEAAYQERVGAEMNRKAWEASPRPTELPPGRYLAQTEAQGSHWEAAIGILAAPGGPSRMDVLYQGKLLCNEPLDDMPPGATAVLNVRQGKVDSSWTRLDGREYRAALKELKAEVRKLFQGMSLTDPVELYPALRTYLWANLVSKRPEKVALKAPLFATLDGRQVSLDALSKWSVVSVGQPLELSDRIPKTLLPTPILRYSPEVWQALSVRLGPGRINDVRPLQERLQGIDLQLASPAPPVLPPDNYLSRKELELEGARGQIGLTAVPGVKMALTLLYQGAVFERTGLHASRVLRAVATLEAGGLTLTPAWNGFVENAQYKSLMAAIKAEVLALERDLLDHSELTPELRIKLFQAYPTDSAGFREKAFLPTTTYGSHASLADLEKELKEHGHLLRGEPGIAVPGRVALLTPSKDLEKFLHQQLGELDWEEAATALRRFQAAREFQERAVEAEIRLAGDYSVRLPVERLGRGEVALIVDRDPLAGELNCYVQGRFVCRKKGVVPAPFVAALESETFVLSQDFRDVTVPPVTEEMLRELCGRCMLMAARSENEAERELAWEYFVKSRPREEHRAEFMASVLITMLDGSQRSLAELAAGRLEGYVSPSFRTSTVNAAVVRLQAREVRRIEALLGRRALIDLEPTLRAQDKKREALSRIPTSLPKELFQRTYERGALKATLGVSLKRLTVGLDQTGAAVGYLRDLILPVQAVVWGATESKKKDLSKLHADLPPKDQEQVNEWAEQLCLEWVNSLPQPNSLECALLLLQTTMREIGSRGGRAEIARRLWDTPLFERVDGTRVSGAALAATLSETGQPLRYSEHGFRAAPDVLLLEDSSPAHSILRAMLGDQGLLPYEAPPLIDAAKLKKSVKSLVDWGLAPVNWTFSKMAEVRKAIASAFPESEPEPEPTPEPTPEPEPKAKAKEKARSKPAKPVWKAEVFQEKRDPKDILVVNLKEEVRNLLGSEHFRKSDELFVNLTYGAWPLGPPIYKARDHVGYRLNSLHSAVRWLLSDAGDARAKRVARVLLVVHWVGLVNVASEQLRDDHEDEFLDRLVERMAQTFG